MEEIIKKKCTRCKEERPLTDFFKNRTKKDGHECWCKECSLSVSAEYKKNHKEQIKEKQKETKGEYYKRFKERIKEKSRIYRLEHPEQCKEYKRNHMEQARGYGIKRYKKHREKILTQQRLRRSNPDYREYMRSYLKAYKKTAKGKEIKAKDNYRRRVLVSGSINDLTYEQWNKIKEYQFGMCLGCGLIEPAIKLTMDHIIPISLGGEHTKSNIQGLCAPCNASKGNKIDSPLIKTILIRRMLIAVTHVYIIKSQEFSDRLTSDGIIK